MARKTRKKALVFIDTNILLDFYRSHGTAKGQIPFLAQIDHHHDDIITGEQVEMEYKKNRQPVIVDTIGKLGKIASDAVRVPAFLMDKPADKTLKKSIDAAKHALKRIKKKMERVLDDPVHHDPVYPILQRLFRADGPYALTRQKSERHQIRRLAKKRFSLGYPPRKVGETSIGDAVNWEWIVACAKSSKRDIVIVTRDDDYGKTHEGKPRLNDWLRQEFKDRIGPSRKITVTNRIAQAYKLAGIKVTKDEAAEEERHIDERPSPYAQIMRQMFPHLYGFGSSTMHPWMSEMLDGLPDVTVQPEVADYFTTTDDPGDEE